MRLLSILAGVLFGTWPLLMNRSNLQGASANLVAGICGVVVMLPIVLASGFKTTSGVPHWYFALSAGFVAAMGMLAFNHMLAHTPSTKVGWSIVVVVLTQVAISVVYQIVMEGGLTTRKLLGLAAAGLAIWLLNSNS